MPWLRSRWVGLLIQQSALFAIGIAFVLGVRNVTGRTLRNVEDPPGPIVLAAYIALVALVVGGTWWLYRRFAGRDAPELGLALSGRRLLELAAGFLVGALVNGAPWALSLLVGRARFVEEIWDVHAAAQVFVLIATGALIAFFNAFLEEVTSRAYPIRLWSSRPVVNALVVSAVFFALQHLVGEGPDVGRLIYLFSLGVLFGAAYVVRGHIWLACGLHMGYFWISLALQGRWHAGSVIQIAGSPVVPWTIIDAILALAALVVLFWFGLRGSRVGATSGPEEQSDAEGT